MPKMGSPELCYTKSLRLLKAPLECDTAIKKKKGTTGYVVVREVEHECSPSFSLLLTRESRRLRQGKGKGWLWDRGRAGGGG